MTSRTRKLAGKYCNSRNGSTILKFNNFLLQESHCIDLITTRTRYNSLDNDFSVGGLLGWMPPLTNRQAFSTIHNLRLRPLCSLIRQRILPNLAEYRRYAPTLDGSAFRTGVVRYLKAHIPRYDTSLRLLLRPSGALCYRSKLTCRKKRLL